VQEVGSEDWVRALSARLDGVVVDPAVEVVVQHRLPDTGASWHVVVAGGRAAVAAGEHPSPDVTFTEDAATASAVARGELAAQQAFLDGRLRVAGRVGCLTGPVAAALAGLPGVPARA